jgi:hypothetical protein
MICILREKPVSASLRAEVVLPRMIAERSNPVNDRPGWPVRLGGEKDQSRRNGATGRPAAPFIESFPRLLRRGGLRRAVIRREIIDDARDLVARNR